MGVFKRYREHFWTTGEPWNGIRTWVVPRFFQVWHSALCCTLKITTTGFGRGMPLTKTGEQGALLVCWHDKTLMPLHIFRDNNFAGMFSTSRAGNLQGEFWARYGWRIVRGSTKKRAGIIALREAMRLLRDGQTFAFTPDGPKGPRHKAQGGIVYMASNAGAVILPVGVAASRCWLLRSWDKHLIPKPFAHVHMHIGEPFYLPADIARHETARYLEQVEAALEAADREAERQVRAKQKNRRPQ